MQYFPNVGSSIYILYQSKTANELSVACAKIMRCLLFGDTTDELFLKYFCLALRSLGEGGISSSIEALFNSSYAKATEVKGADRY
jgi:hypothetical protein